MKSINLTNAPRIKGTFLEVTPNQLRQMADFADQVLKETENVAVQLPGEIVLFFKPDNASTHVRVQEIETLNLGMN